MGDDFLAESSIIYIQRQIVKKYSVNDIIDDLKMLKESRALLSFKFYIIIFACIDWLYFN